VNRYQKGKINLDFTDTRDSEWQWHQLGHMQVCTSLQTDNHASTPPLSVLQAGCPSCRPTNSIKALKAQALELLWLEPYDKLFGQSSNQIKLSWTKNMRQDVVVPGERRGAVVSRGLHRWRRDRRHCMQRRNRHLVHH